MTLPSSEPASAGLKEIIGSQTLAGWFDGSAAGHGESFGLTNPKRF
jgi:hypothetical protein